MAQIKVRINITKGWADGVITLSTWAQPYAIDGFPPTGDSLRDSAEVLRRAATKLDDIRQLDTVQDRIG